MIENIDLRCAQIGEKMAEGGDHKNLERLLTSSLGVLEEQGVYAFFLYLHSRSKSEIDAAREINRRAIELLTKNGASHLIDVQDKTKPWESLQNLAQDLDRLLFARDLLRQALVYGRHHAKAQASNRGDE